MADTPLRDVPGWTEAHVERLERAWLTTAEQVVAVSATEGGLQSLAEQLEASDEEARRLVEAARAALPLATRAELEQPVDTSEYGLGVRRPRPGGGGRNE